MSIDRAYQILYLSVLIVFALLIGAMLIRSVIGPRITDRILSINMLGTMTICSIAILSRLLSESYLVDVALIYAMLSFVAVLMLAVMYIPSQHKREKDVNLFGPKSREKKAGSSNKKRRKAK